MDLRTAAQAMLDSYAEHLNNHCARCTAAFDQLRAALEEPGPTATAQEFKTALGVQTALGARQTLTKP